MKTMPQNFTAVHFTDHRTNPRSVGRVILTFSILSIFWVTQVGASSSQVKLLEIPVLSASIPKTLTFPVYEQASIQYFSAGLGKEERSLTYPPFSLKLIFVQGKRAYLAGVSTVISKEDGTQLLRVPEEEVEGPWLFLNLPTGNFIVSGTDSNGTTIKKTIRIEADKSTVVHFRFP